MESIAILKPNMGVLSQERLALSPFGALAQAFAEELLARAKREEGAWSYVPLDLLEEETAQPAPIQQTTVLQVDLKLVLEALKRETVRTEQLRATERIVERLLQRQKARQEKAAPPAPIKPEAASHPSVPKPVTPFQQTLFQTIHQNVHLHLPEQNSLPFSGQSGVVRLTAPGQLGQRASEFSQALRVLREEGKSFATEEREASKNDIQSDGHRHPQELTFREDSEKKTPIQSHSVSETRLLHTAERLERMLSSETQSQTHPEKKSVQIVPTVQNVGPKQENPLPEGVALQKSASGSLHTTNQSNQANQTPQTVGEHVIETTARQIGTDTAQKPGPAARDIRTVTLKSPEDIQAKIGEAGTQVPSAFVQKADQTTISLPGVELTHRTEEGTELEEATSQSNQSKLSERSAKSAPAETKQSSSSTTGETKRVPESRKSEMGQTVREIQTAVSTALEHIQKEAGAQTQSTTSVPSSVPAVQRTVERGANASAEIEQLSVREERVLKPEAGRTVRDIRTVTPATPESVQVEAGTQVPSTPVQNMAQKSAPLPDVELAYRTEEGTEQEETTSQSKPSERGAKSTPAETKQSSSSEASETKHAPESLKSEIGRTVQDIRTVTPATLEVVQVEAGTRAPSTPVQNMAQKLSPFSGVELAYRTEEETEQEEATSQSKPSERSAKSTLAETKQPSSSEASETKRVPESSKLELGRMVQDIRTVTPATPKVIQVEAGTQALSTPVQDMAQKSAPLPGVELAYWMEEGIEQEEATSRSKPSERSAKSTPAETKQSSSGKADETKHTPESPKSKLGRTIQDIRTVTPATPEVVQVESGTQALSAPVQNMAQKSVPLPGVELAYRTEEGTEQEEAASHSKPSEQIAKSTPAEIKQPSSSEGIETKHTSESPKPELGRTVQDIRTVTPATPESMQAEAGAQVPSALVQKSAQKSAPLPGVELAYRTEEGTEQKEITSRSKPSEQSAKSTPAETKQLSSSAASETKHAPESPKPELGRTVQDIRTVTPATPESMQAEAGAQVLSASVQNMAQKFAPLSGVELTYWTEEETEQENNFRSERPEAVQAVRDIRTVRPTTPERAQAEPGVQTPLLSAPGTIPPSQIAPAQDTARTSALLPGVELTYRTEEGTEQDEATSHSKPSDRSAKSTPAERKQAFSSEAGETKYALESSKSELGRTVQDIRTVTLATPEVVQVEAGTQAPSALVQESAQMPAPLPGVELTYRTEEGTEQEEVTSRSKPSEQSAKSTPAETKQLSSSAASETKHAPESPKPELGRTVQDIRTVTPATLDSVQAEAGTQAPSALVQKSVQKSAPLPGVELTYRTEEGTERESGFRLERPEAVQAVRDIRTIRPTTPERAQAEPGVQTPLTSVPGTIPPSQTAPEQDTARTSALLSGVELTYRAEELDESQIPAAQKGQVSTFQEGQTQPRAEGGSTQPGRRTWRATYPASAWTDIRVSRNLLHSAAPTFVPEGEPLWKTAPASVPPQTELDYGGGQERALEPSVVRGRFVQRPAPPDDAEEPVPLTYGPTAALANQTPPPEPQSHSAPEESEFVRSLPDWARRFLRENAVGSEPQSMGVARNISALPEPPGEQQIQWTAPNYQPTEPLAHREKQQEEPPRPSQPVRISEAEIQRTADRVYRMIEERIREDRIRLGR